MTRHGALAGLCGFMLLVGCAVLSAAHAAAPGIDAITMTANPQGGQSYTVSLQILVLMTALSLLPSLLLGMTSFTRIMVVMAILRQALGTGQTPSNQVLLGVSLFLTLFTMLPVFEQVHEQAYQPYIKEQITPEQAVEKAGVPFRQFMLRQTRETDLELFVRLSGKTIDTPEETPFSLLVPAFMISELKTAFQIGFLLFLPFLIIDLVVATVLMSIDRKSVV